MVSSLFRRTNTAGLATLFGIFLAVACSKEKADQHLQRADEYVKRAMLKEATIEYRTAVQLEPRRGDIRLKLADTLLLQSDAGAALKEFVRAADLLPNDVTAQIKAGTMLLTAGAFEDAKSRAEKAIAIDPKNASAQILRGNALAGLRDADGALAEYQEALALNPGQEAAYRNIATIQYSRGNQAEAEASFKKAIEAAPRSVPARLSLASFLWASNRVAEAEQVLKEAIALDPAEEAANRALGTLYVGTDRAANAEPYFKAVAKTRNTTTASLSLADYYVLTKRFDEGRKILSEVATNPQARDAANIRLAGIAAAQGNRAQAVSTLREVLERRPKEAAARVVLARLLLQDDKRDEALAQAMMVAREAPTSSVAADAYSLIGAIQEANDRREDAISAYEEVLKRQAQPLAADLALAALYLSGGNLDKAATYARQALVIRPKDPTGRSLMVRVLVAQKQFTNAKEIWSSLQADFPNTPGVLELLGTMQYAQGQLDAARASFTRAAAMAPKNVGILAEVVRTDLASGRTNDAVNRIEAALKMERSADLLLLAARTYAAARNHEKTEEVLMKAIETQPTRLQPYGLLASLYVGEQRLEEARERFQQAVDRDPKSVAMNTALGMVLELQKRIPEAEKQYKTVLAIDPQAAVAANNLAWLYVSSDRNLDEALQFAQTAQQVMPDDPSVNDTLGWIYYKKRMMDPAVRHLEVSTQKGPNDPSRHYHLGMAYVQMGQFDKAKKSLQRAFELKADFEGAAEARKALSQVGG